MKIVMTKGLPGSGKSTWAKQLIDKEPETWKRVNKDDLRSMVDNGKWSKNNEKLILQMRDALITSSLINGKNVIVDDTNLSEKHEKDLRALAVLWGHDFEIKDFTDVALDICIDRDSRREHPVGEKVIRKMYNEFLKPKEHALNPVIFSYELPYAVIFDLDGTLAHIGDRSPYDSRNCGVDELNGSISWLLLAMKFDIEDMNVILCSGRKEEAREATVEWLVRHDIKWDQLFMRKDGDDRKDSIVKKEIFENEIKNKYNIVFVVDDRDQVVKVWRDLGLTCLQCNYGNF